MAIILRSTCVAAALGCVIGGQYMVIKNPHHHDTSEQKIILEPEVQNIPLDGSGLRPPPPRIPSSFDFFIASANYRDGTRCGYALWTAFARAARPEKVFVGVIDQTHENDVHCLDEYCKLAKNSWPDEECKYKDHIKIDAVDARESKGPAVARARQRALIGDQEFCMSVDTHTQFVYNWDDLIVEDWKKTNNEMAVLSVYPLGFDRIGPNFTAPTGGSRHMCVYGQRDGGHDVPLQWSVPIEDSEVPQMQAFWGGGMSFSKCHAEKRVPIDGHLTWVFYGEEFIRGMQLWTNGYDIYSPSVHGSVLLHNYTGEKPTFYENAKDNSNKRIEEIRGYNRLRAVLRFPFEGEVDAMDLETYYGHPVRTLDEYLSFSKLTNTPPFDMDDWPCEQLHWVPYAVPEIVEDLLPGYKMYPNVTETSISVQQIKDAVVADVAESVSQRLQALQLNDSIIAAIHGQVHDSSQKLANSIKSRDERVHEKLDEIANSVSQLKVTSEPQRTESKEWIDSLQNQLKVAEEHLVQLQHSENTKLEAQVAALAKQQSNTALYLLGVIVVICGLLVFVVLKNGQYKSVQYTPVECPTE